MMTDESVSEPCYYIRFTCLRKHVKPPVKIGMIVEQGKQYSNGCIARFTRPRKCIVVKSTLMSMVDMIDINIEKI